MNQLDQVLLAIETFFSPSTPAETRIHTGKLLENFQNTVFAWNASVELLSNPSASVNPSIGFFASQTLKHKLVYDWRQLDDSAALGLRERLWTMLFSNCNLNGPVQVQLKLALAALIVQIPCKLWSDPVGDLFVLAGNNPGRVSEVLSLLSMIPEQLRNKTIQFSSNDEYYDRCNLLLEKHVDSLIQMVLTVLQGSLEDRLNVTKALLSCLLSWIQFGGDGSKIIESPDFLNGLFTLLLSSCTHILSGAQAQPEDSDVEVEDEEEHLQIIEIASELLIELVVRMSGRVEDFDDQDCDEANNAAVGDGWFTKLNAVWIPVLSKNLTQLPIVDVLRLKSSKKSREEGREDDDSLLKSLISLLCESLEVFMPSLIERRAEFMILTEAVLAVSESSVVSSNTLELTFNFWAALPSELASFSTDDLDTQYEPFAPHYSRLFNALLKGPLIFPPNGSAEEIDRFRDFRHVVGDCLKDCVKMLGSTETLLLLHRHLVSTPINDFVGREAVFFALRTVSSSVDPRESEAMPLIAPLLLTSLQELLQYNQNLNIRTSGLKMISAVILNVGCYSEWLRYHSEFIGSFLLILSISLDYSLQSTNVQNPIEKSSTVIGSALQSLKYMCESCSGLLGPQYGALEGLFLRVYPWNEGLCRRDRQDLTEAVAMVLSRRSYLTEEEFMGALERLLQPIWQAVNQEMSDCLEDYAVILECAMLPEMSRTLTIFSKIFLPSFPKLADCFLGTVNFSKIDDEERFGDAWIRVINAAINNGTAGAVGDFINSTLIPWISCLTPQFPNLSPTKQAIIYRLISSLISSGQSSMNPEMILEGILSTWKEENSFNDLWVIERCNLMRVVIVYVFSSASGGVLLYSFLSRIRTPEMLSNFLGVGKNLSSAEIVSLCGFLGALFGSLEFVVIEGGGAEMKEFKIFLEGVMVRIVEATLLEWPLSHVNDLAVLLNRAGRDSSPLKSLTENLFSPTSRLPARLFSAATTTPQELTTIAADYEKALGESIKNFRPKNLRMFIKGIAEMCRRRRI